MRKLGQGGMGIVHLAQDAQFRLVAVKVLRPELADDEGFRRRFAREAQAARQVARFCTAPVLDAGIDGKVAYLVTEYVDGPDLSEVVAAHGSMEEPIWRRSRSGSPPRWPPFIRSASCTVISNRPISSSAPWARASSTSASPASSSPTPPSPR
ncbi:hypothetical protein ACFQ0B_55100 [Nonomuraea thailandensis]